MHLQQTKQASRKTGGPQYYFHSLTNPVKLHLRDQGAVRVALVTPYGATKTSFFAVGADHKLKAEKAVPGSVGHDRIQQGSASESIGEAIRRWYGLKPGDFHKIDVDVDIVDDDFYVIPKAIDYAGAKRTVQLENVERPLTFTKGYVSPLWRAQVAGLLKKERDLVLWSLKEICRVVTAHLPNTKEASTSEDDLLRASGPLAHLGVSLGPLKGKGYDCRTEVRFLDYPSYGVNFELKKKSSGFKYQEKKYGKDELSRAVVLCAIADHKSLHRHIDVIELQALCDYQV